MTAVALRGLLARRTRAVLTAIAVIVGVAMISGTMMLTDSVDRAFDSIFAGSYSGTDAFVSGEPVVEGASAGAPPVPEDVLGDVRALPSVESAAGAILDFDSPADSARLLDRSGDPIGTEGILLGVDPEQDRFNPLTLTEGRWASGPDEIVIDSGTAADAGLGVGDAIGASANRSGTFEITGVATLGDLDSLGGTTIGVTDVPTAQRLLDRSGFDVIAVGARAGVSDAELTSQLEDVVPAGMRVETSDARADREGARFSEVVGFIRWFLLAFGAIALFVGAFVIANTLSITVAQRTREIATLRTLGATRRQVLRSVVVEALAIGVAASLAGIALGVGLAEGLSTLFASSGVSLPEAGIRLSGTTITVSLVTGVVVTLAASLLPAIRATRVAPIAAIQEGAPAPARRRRTTAIAAGVTAVSAAAFAYGVLGDVPVSTRMLAIGLGFPGLCVGVAMFAPRLVAPLAAIVGAPSARLGGAAGALARENSVRNPSRTAATAAALMIGLALVTVVAVLGGSIARANRDTISSQVAASHVLSSDDGYSLLPPSAAGAVEGVDGVLAVSGVREEQANVDGHEARVDGVDAADIDSVYRFRPAAGAAPADTLAAGGAVVAERFAHRHGIGVGDEISIQSPSGEVVGVPVGTIDDPPPLAPLLGDVTIDRDAFDAAFPRPRDRYVLIDATPGAVAGLEQAASTVPGAGIRTREEFVDLQVEDFGTILNLLYVLLALSVVVSLIGMVNTLVLAVVERTRELGMLRVVGMTRRQVRAMVRHESVITALIGAALGIPLGIGLAAVVVEAMSTYGVGLAVPVGQLALFALIAIAAGVLAAVAPARRAARLRPLEALRHE